MKRAKWILAVLTVLALCVIGVTALADGETPEIHLTGIGADENGVITVPVYGEVKVNVTANDSVIHNQIEEFHFVNGQWTEDINPWDLWQNGYVQMCWRPNSETPQDFTVYAYARIKGEDGQPDRLVRSNELTVRVTVDEAITDEVTYIVDGETDGHPAAEPIDVPKDGALVLKVDNIGADYYGAEIDRTGIHLDHIAESRWVTPEPGSTTEVRLPVFECEVGQEYEVRVYALKIGAPMKYAAQTVWVQVTERATDAPLILEIAKDPDDQGVYHYDTDERIRIYSHYENLDGALDEEFSWIQVRAFNDHKDYCFWDESGDGFYYWTDGMRIGNPGDYLIEAVVMTNADHNWDTEAQEVAGTKVTARIHVEASAEERLAAPVLTVNPFLSTAGVTDVTLNVGAVDHAERYFYWIHPSDGDMDRMNGDLAAAGPVSIDTGLLGPGVYTAVVSAHARGYEENFTTCDFVVFGSDDTDLSTANYYFSTNARPAAEGATNFIADVGEEIRFIGFMPGSGEINLGRKQIGWDETQGIGYCEAPGMALWYCFDEEGIYTIYMGGTVNGVWTEYPVCTVAVSADGSLNDPAVAINGIAFADQAVIAPDADNPHKLTVTFDKVPGAEHFFVVIRPDSEDWIVCEENMNAEDCDGTTIRLEIENDAIQPGNVYRIYVEASAYGINWGRTEGTFLLAEGVQTAGISLTVNGSAESDQTVLSSSNLHVQVTWPEGPDTLGRPTAVRVLNNNRWEYMWNQEDDCQRDWGFGDGQMFLYAEATWDNRYDFEQLERDGWRDFDWDRDVAWTGKSNIIKLNVISPNGTMIAPEFSLAKSQLAWGEDLVVTIADEGPSRIDPDAQDGRSVVKDGWFFFNIEVECGDHWDRYDEFRMNLHSGENTIPTYWITPGSRCRIEIGADGEGYGGRSTWREFTVAEREPEAASVKMFRVNGVDGGIDNPGALSVDTMTELYMQAYMDGAEWYNVEITEKDNDDWRENCGECRIGMLTDSWHSCHAGEFTLTAYAYGRRDGREWEELIGTVDVTYNAPNGNLDPLTATMVDRAYAGDEVVLTFNPVANAPEGTEYGYWLHEDTDGRWLMGDTFPQACSVTIDTSGLEPDVYWVEMDATAPGYNQSHAELHIALLDPDDTEMSGDTYYFTTSMQPPERENLPDMDFVVPASQDFRFTFYVPGAEEVSLKQKRSDWDDPDGFAGCEGPGISQWHSFDRWGEYTIYGQYRANGQWSDDIALCTVTVTAEDSLARPWVDMPMVVGAGEDVHLTYHIDPDAESYSYWVSYEDEGWNICGEWIDVNELGEDVIAEGTFDFVIPADRLEANRVYHVYLDTGKPGWEQGHDDRQLFVLGEADPEAVTLTVRDQNGQPAESIAIGERYPVTVDAPGAETLHIWWDETWSFIDLDGDHFEQDFCYDLIGEDSPHPCTFYAFATYDRSWLKVSDRITIDISNWGVPDKATQPTLRLVNQGTIYKGQLVLADVGEIPDEGVYEYCACLMDEFGNLYCQNSRGDAGIIAIPTNDLEAGKQYNVRAYARVLGKYRSEYTAGLTFRVSEPTGNLFEADKETVAVMEKLTVSILAPGATRVRFNSGYEGWDEFDSDSWYSDSISWDMSEDNVTIRAEAWFPDSEGWTPIGDGIPISITADGNLDQPEFINLPESIVQGQDLDFEVEAVEGAEEYEVQLNRFDGRDGMSFRSASPSFHIPSYRLYSGGYRVNVIALAYGKNSGQNETSLYVEPVRPEIGIASVVSNTENLDITVPLVDGGENYYLMIHYVPYDDFEESILYQDSRNADDADRDGILTFTVPAGTLRDNMTHWVDLTVDGHDFYAENSKAFLVRNGQTDDNVTVTVNGETGEASVMIHDDFSVNVSAPGAKAIIIRCGDMWQAYAGSTVTDIVFNEYQVCSEILYAQAYYGNEADLPEEPWDGRWLDLEWGLPGDPVAVNFYAIGQVGEPWAVFPTIVHQGEILVISDIYPGEGGNETHANISRNDPGQEEDRVFGDDWQSWDEYSRTIYLPTDGLEANRDYWIMLDNSGIGLEGNRIWWRVSVFPGEDLPAGGVAINTLEKVQAGMEIPVSISAPGAVEVGFGLDLAAEEKADITNYQFRGEEGIDTLFTRDGWFRIDEPGRHTLTAYAVFPDAGNLAYTDKDILICDPLRFDMTTMPGFFTEGQDDASVTVKLPEDAQRMSIQAHVEGENYWYSIYDSREQDEYGDVTIRIPAEQLTAGRLVVVDFQAKAYGFTDAGDGIRIPVTAGTMTNKVNLRLVNNREEQTAVDPDDIWANQEMVYLATPTDGNDITAIRFFNGREWWEGGNAITPENHGDWYLDDGSVFFHERYNEDDNRKITAFAEVQVNGSSTWQRTNEIHFTVKNNGMVGEYDFADGSDITVPRGTVVTVEFTEAENATHYWIDAFDEYRGWNPMSRSDGTTVQINTNRLPAGTYELWGRAGGADGSGLQWRESYGYVTLTITDDVPQPADATFTTPRGLTVIEDEAFAGIAAKVIVVTRDVESVGENAFTGAPVEQVSFLNADTEIDWSAFEGRSNLTVYGIPGGKVEQWAEENFYAFYPLIIQE